MRVIAQRGCRPLLIMVGLLGPATGTSVGILFYFAEEGNSLKRLLGANLPRIGVALRLGMVLASLIAMALGSGAPDDWGGGSGW